MKKFLFSLIIGSCLIGSGIIVFIYELAEWPHDSVDVYALGYQKMVKEYHYILNDNKLVIDRWVMDTYSVEIVYVENQGNNMTVTITYPNEIYNIEQNFNGEYLDIYSTSVRFVNSIKFAIKLLENEQLLGNVENSIRITIQIDPSVQIFNTEVS